MDWRDYTHLMKLDGDIELAPTYLRELMARFGAEPELGPRRRRVDGGDTGGWKPIDPNRAQSRAWRSEVLFARVLRARSVALQERLGWDTIDETYARMYGFTTRTFRDLVSVHHRPIGSADGTLRGHARHGECAYIGQHTVLWVTLRSPQSRAPAPGRHLRACVPVRIRTSCRATR